MQKVNLNLIPGSVLPVINVSQYDEGRQFQLAVFNGATSYDLTGKTVMVDVQKTDGHGCEYGTADEVHGVPVVAVSGNIVTITTPQQMTACAGDCAGELKITDSTSTIGTLNFVLMCEPAPLNDGTIISDTELPAIIDAARSSAERAEDAAQDAEAAAAHYPYPGDDGYWYVWDVETEQYIKTDVSAAGRAPDITMTATADATSSPTPTVTVTKTGTDEEPNFALAFSGLKGAKGDTGPIGPTGDSQDVLEAVGWTGANLFEGLDDVYVFSGIDITRQNDRKYLVSGTKSGTSGSIYRVGTFTCKAGVEYKVSGCPTGGGMAGGGFWLGAYAVGDSSAIVSDAGTGATITAFNTDTEIELGIRIAGGYVCPSNFLWSPMISRNGGEYVPYHPTVQEELWDGKVSKPKNLIKYRADLPKVYTENTVTFTVNDDYSVTVNTSAPTTADVRFGLTYELVDFYPDGNYVLSDVNGSSNGVYTTIWRRKQAGTAFSDLGTGEAQPRPFTVNNADKGRYLISLYIKSGKTVNNVTLYPMICTLEDWNKSHAYSPYYVPLKDSMLRRSEQRVLGAKNLWDDTKVVNSGIESENLIRFRSNSVGGSWTRTADGYDVQCTTTNWSGCYFSGTDIARVFSAYDEVTLSFEYKGDMACTVEIGMGTRVSSLTTTWTKYSVTFKPSDASNLAFYNRDTTKAPTISIRNMMVRLASDPDDTYAPYAETNFELTQNKFSNSNVAPTEDGETASQNIAVNDLFIRGGALCICDQPISLGGSFTEGTNYHITTLAAVIAALRA